MSYARELSRRLAAQAEAVCRAYLPAGRRNGRYWIVGDVQGTRGRSLFVKLSGDGAGRWTDAASGEYGDLLDLIRLNRGLNDVRAAFDEARYFLRDPEPIRNRRTSPARKPPRDTLAAAEKLHRFSRPVPHTPAETYLRGRAITANLYRPALRFHAACTYRPEDGGPCQSWPALLGVVTDLDGSLTGLQRTWLARDGGGKEPVVAPVQRHWFKVHLMPPDNWRVWIGSYNGQFSDRLSIFQDGGRLDMAPISASCGSTYPSGFVLGTVIIIGRLPPAAGQVLPDAAGHLHAPGGRRGGAARASDRRLEPREFGQVPGAARQGRAG